MKTYLVKLKHDQGFVTLYIKAESEQAAKEMTCKAENCPECAIISIRRYFGYVPSYLLKS